MAAKAQNETDTSDLDVPSHPGSSTTHHRPGHSGANHHRRPHDHHRHGVSHHHGGSHLDSPDSAFSRHSPNPSTTLASTGSHGTVLSHQTNEKVPIRDEHHRGGRRHHGRPPHVSEFRHHGGLHHEGEPSHSKDGASSGSHHSYAYDHSKRRRHVTHHHRRPLHHGESSSHHGISRDPSEHHHGHRGHPGEHHRREHRHGEYPSFSSRDLHTGFSVARVSSIFQPTTAHKQSTAISLTRSRSAVRSRASKSSRVHPLESLSRISESWPEDEPVQMQKTNKTSRGHKKAHSENICSKLFGNFCSLFYGLRKMLSVLTQSLFFDAFIFIVVCLNIIMLVAQTFAKVEVRGAWYFMAFDSIFLSIYVVEALLKIISMGLDYFYDSWNILDFFIVATAVLEFTLVQFNSRSLQRTVYNPNFFRIFKVFRSLRALRAVRVLKRLSFLTSLQEVTGTLVRSMPSITAILVLMFTCLLLFSVVLRGLFRQSDPKRFQNIFTTIFTLFTLLTLDDWSQIYVDSRANGAWYIIPILMIYIIIQYFIFLNLVIAVLVDNFQMALLRGLEKVKQERAAQIQEKLLAESLTKLNEAEPEEVLSEHTKQKLLIEKKFGTMTTKQQELLFHFLQLATGVEHYQQKFRSQASVIDEIVDTAFEAGEEDFRK
ncbi:cation channel sperm-associated protein 1 [Myotis myotis]|uniref:cation channel sperm-associated protein 1 n=1 Tax=Myotis myotis TaxID=51298 RepID=UPI00174DDE0D|nr:cation channel sperm-associated protein 1 [Myotis myotis]